MGTEFITRSLKSCGVVLLVFLPFGMYYMGVYPSLAVLSGGVWGILNLIFIMRLIRVTIRPDGAKPMAAIGMAIFKFPLLYVAGYFLLSIEKFDPLYLVIGFSSVIVILVLRVLGRSLVESNADADNSAKLWKV